MELKDLVPNKDLCQDLKNKGYPQETIFKYCGGHIMYWEDQDGKFEECPNDDLLDNDEYCHTAELSCEFTIAAPTVGEIGEQLPAHMLPQKNKEGLYVFETEYHHLVSSSKEVVARAVQWKECKKRELKN